MDTSTTPVDNSVYRERLQQAKRVIEGLPEHQREKLFDIAVFAVESEWGTIACIAGHCGLDPWFQELGFFTDTRGTFGEVSISPGEFFGTEIPFYAKYYQSGKSATTEDALRALDRAIASFANGPSTSEEVPQ